MKDIAGHMCGPGIGREQCRRREGPFVGNGDLGGSGSKK